MEPKYKLLILLTTTLLFQPTTPQEINTENWWCGSTHSEASTQCSQPCPSGQGCPLDTLCFSGITACAPSTPTRYCGMDYDDASSRCGTPCSTGGGCPLGEACFSDVTCGAIQSGDAAVSSSSSSSGGNIGGSFSGSSSSSNLASSSSLTTSSALGGKTGIAAIEETFLSMKTAINEKLFLYETPMMEWIPSTVYRFDGFFDGLKIMHSQGVAGNKLYMGGDCDHCHMYGLVNVAGFLSQAMKETIRYDACDENSWDRVGADLTYPISNACGQLGQSYQDYHCSDEEKHMECEVDPQMTITAVTNAKWWGAPGPLQCGPKSLIPQTGHWDYKYTCDNIWGSPPETCDAYEGQTGGKAINDVPYPNAAGRTDVEGCCWWGRGVIQTSGVCNFGKLNYFLGKRAADEGRDSRYPNIDFCRDPESICTSQEHKELKWIAGFFYWISEVQPYDNGGWNYIDELHKFVDGGLEGDEFINAVSGIVNRGCHNPPCGTGELDGGPARAQNFFDIIKEMKFSFVDVPQTNDPVPEPEEAFLMPEGALPARPEVVRYTCGDGYQFDGSDAFIPPSAEISFDYEVHNGIDVTIGDALKDVKQSILADLTGRMACYKSSSGRKLQGVFENIIALQSSANDLPDSDASGCIVDVETDDPTTCTPVSGGFTIYAKPGTSELSLEETSDSLKAIIQKGMDAGIYETETVDKAIYIGERDNFSKAETSSAPTNVQGEGTDGEGMKIAIYVLACACLILICALWFTVWTYRENEQKEQKHDEEMAFNQYMMEKEEIDMQKMMRETQGSNYHSESQHRPPPPPPPGRQSQNRNRRNTFATLESNRGEEPPLRPRLSTPGGSMERGERNDEFPTFESNGREALNRSRSSSRGNSQDRRGRKPEVADEFSWREQATPNDVGSVLSESSSDSSAEDMTPIVPQNQSPPKFQSNSHGRMPPLSKKASFESGSVSSDSCDSSGSSSEGNTYNDCEQHNAVEDTRGSVDALNKNSPGYSKSVGSSLSNPCPARDERQKRMAQARARAASRRRSLA